VRDFCVLQTRPSVLEPHLDLRHLHLTQYLFMIWQHQIAFQWLMTMAVSFWRRLACEVRLA
jgi:hypothetical protein